MDVIVIEFRLILFLLGVIVILISWIASRMNKKLDRLDDDLDHRCDEVNTHLSRHDVEIAVLQNGS